jgi:hypothetical protein
LSISILRGSLTAAEIAAVILIVLAMSTTTSYTASANAAIAKSTGQPCTKCHTAPPALNKYGKKYKESKKNSLARSEQNRLLLTQTRVGFDMDGAVL